MAVVRVFFIILSLLSSLVATSASAAPTFESSAGYSPQSTQDSQQQQPEEESSPAPDTAFESQASDGLVPGAFHLNAPSGFSRCQVSSFLPDLPWAPLTIERPPKI